MKARKILVIEDDHEIREALCDFLQDEGYEVITAENGAIALDQLAAMNELPSLILLDISMPILDGHGFRHRQAADPRLANIPTAMISADGNLAKKAERAGVVEYLKKPVELTDLLQLAARHCG